ncbi:uncharacterized protein G2W53_011565 [Senna tora]|uniref:Uncharacterized protein n=1 Tax=Senna tora TaxID=362788 RepID=A0A834X209_9FABA|nr:uncharacterized protein G2W53_011565 [Senna tora]
MSSRLIPSVLASVRPRERRREKKP